MYAISNTARVYISAILLFCSSIFSAASLASENGYWSTLERRFIPQSEVNLRVQRLLDNSVSKPTGTSLSISPSSPSVPTATINASGGLSANTQNVIKTAGYPSPFDSTLNHSLASAKNALKVCLRSPACASRALGAGAVIYEGINAWRDVYDILLDSKGSPSIAESVYVPPSNPSGDTCLAVNGIFGSGTTYPTCLDAYLVYNNYWCVERNRDFCPTSFKARENDAGAVYKDGGYRDFLYYIAGSCPVGSRVTAYGCESDTQVQTKPLTLSQLDVMVDGSYVPHVSDAPIVLLSGNPESITLTTPSPVDLPATTTTNTNSQGQTTTSVTNQTLNYNVTNNTTTSPIISSTATITTTVYDSTGNVTDTTTGTTNQNGVQPDFPAPAPIVDFELPSFCSWASVLCDWLGWTKEGVDEPEPDLANLISEFEPDENQYNSSIGAGSCPAPMSLELGIINRTVEVSYQPFCDFLNMIRPLVVAGAWLLSAFMYVGVLRRG